ncbi:MAG: lipopolysaccharide biosynthesis protein [Muribaculum sp.]|nr:lipopolysaccharide biosynthesis protein [Muribaculum sp.]
MTNLKNTAIKATKWSAIERFAVQFIQLGISIIIARMLLPSDYGIIGMVAILLGISQSFVDSGFSQALIYKTNRSNVDSSTVFYFNIIISLICYCIIFFIAPYVAVFYDMPILSSVTRVISLSIPISALAMVQRALLTAKTDFKSQTTASVPAAILSGLTGVILAYYGFGVWALVWQQISYLAIDTMILWKVSKWRPLFCFSIKSFKSFFNYGSKLLVSGLIDTIYNNSFLLVIGKCFKATELGLYAKAKTFPYFVSVNLSGIFQRALFPILCNSKGYASQLVHTYREYLKLSLAITSPLILGLCALAKPFIILLLSEKWIDAVPVLQLLCIFYLFSPIVMINNNIYQVTGRTGLFLKLEIIKKVIGITILIFSIKFGLYGVIIGSIISSIITLMYNMYCTSKIIPLTIKMQLQDIIPILSISLLMALAIYYTVNLLVSDVSQIICGIFLGIVVYLCILKFLLPSIFANLVNIIKKIF